MFNFSQKLQNIFEIELISKYEVIAQKLFSEKINTLK